MLRHGGMIDPGAEGEGDAFLGHIIHIDLIQTDTVLGNDPQAGQGFINHRGSDGIIPADHSIYFADQFEHAFLTQGTALSDQLVALFFQ